METVTKRVLEFWKLIELKASRFGLDPCLLAGLVCQESGGDPDAARPEPIYKWLFGKTATHKARVLKLLPRWRTLAQDFYMQRISYGLCQVMGAVARELGLEGYLTKLCQPDVGLHYGAKVLAMKIAWAKRKGGWKGESDPARAGLLAYNGGGDKQYPAKVMAWAEKIKKEMKA